MAVARALAQPVAGNTGEVAPVVAEGDGPLARVDEDASGGADEDTPAETGVSPYAQGL